MKPATGGSKLEPFGRLNRRTVKKPLLAKPQKKKRPSPPAQINTKLHLYVAGGICFLVLAAYTLLP